MVELYKKELADPPKGTRGTKILRLLGGTGNDGEYVAAVEVVLTAEGAVELIPLTSEAVEIGRQVLIEHGLVIDPATGERKSGFTAEIDGAASSVTVVVKGKIKPKTTPYNPDAGKAA